MAQHVIQRGNNRGDIFRAAEDYLFFLTTLGSAVTRHSLSVHAYVLMTNHVHMVVTPRTQTSLPGVMQEVGRTYVRFYNAKYSRTGGLWEGRYRTSVIQDEEYFVTCHRYVELNPIRAGLAQRPEDYRWSSCRFYSTGREDGLLTPHPLYLGLGETPQDRQQAWRSICGCSIPESKLENIRSAVHSGRFLGEPTELESHRVGGSDPLSRPVNGV